MPVTYEIDKNREVIRTRCVGYVTFPEVLDHFRQLELDENCPARLDVVLDLSETTSLPSSEQLRAVGDKVHRIRGSIRFGNCAIVTSTDAWFGTAQIFEVIAAGSFAATKVFHEGAEAEAWLEERRSAV